MSFSLSKEAKQDLIEIAKYTENTWGRDQRNAYLTKLDNAFHGISEFPGKGKKCEYIRPGHHKFLAGKHMIYYYARDESHVVIVRVLHIRMDIEDQIQ